MPPTDLTLSTGSPGIRFLTSRIDEIVVKKRRIMKKKKKNVPFLRKNIFWEKIFPKKKYSKKKYIGKWVWINPKIFPRSQFYYNECV